MKVLLLMSNCAIVHVQYTLALDNKYIILSCDLRPSTSN